jgi:hypothetical protein
MGRKIIFQVEGDDYFPLENQTWFLTPVYQIKDSQSGSVPERIQILENKPEYICLCPLQVLFTGGEITNRGEL